MLKEFCAEKLYEDPISDRPRSKTDRVMRQFGCRRDHT